MNRAPAETVNIATIYFPFSASGVGKNKNNRIAIVVINANTTEKGINTSMDTAVFGFAKKRSIKDIIKPTKNMKHTGSIFNNGYHDSD